MLLVLVYAFIAKYFGLADYWWKTSLCFAGGCFLAKYRNKLLPLVQKLWVKNVIFVTGCCAFVYTRIDFRYILVPQLLAYVCIAVCIVIVWDNVVGKNFMNKIGKASLAMYLVHIGVVDTVFAMNIMDVNLKVIMFFCIVVIGTTICYLLSEKTNKALLKH